jgi:hypothetical protein
MILVHIYFFFCQQLIIFNRQETQQTEGEFVFILRR